jgi:hypothetical protein
VIPSLVFLPGGKAMGWFGRHGVLLLPVGATSILLTIYTLLGAAPSDMSTLLFQLCWALALILWIEGDARRRRITPCHDFGFLVGVFFPVSVVWYASWSRGHRGVLLLLVLLGLCIVPPMTGLLAWFVARGLR